MSARAPPPNLTEFRCQPQYKDINRSAATSHTELSYKNLLSVRFVGEAATWPFTGAPATKISAKQEGCICMRTRRARLCVTEPNLWICRSHTQAQPAAAFDLAHTQKVNEKCMRSWNTRFAFRNLEVKCLFSKLMFFFAPSVVKRTHWHRKAIIIDVKLFTYSKYNVYILYLLLNILHKVQRFKEKTGKK